jgi:predicted AAA+ superfamily ATPase
MIYCKCGDVHRRHQLRNKLSLVESFRVIFEFFRAQLNVLGRIEQRKKLPVRHTGALEDAQGDVAQQ